MTPFGQLMDKPWLSPGLDPAAPGPSDEQAAGWDRGVGLGLFLLVVTVIFALAASAYMMRMGHGVPSGDWRPFREPPLLWINTAVLVGSSLAFLAAQRSARRADGAATRRNLVLGGLLGLAFLLGQLLLWDRLGDWGYALLYTGSVCRVGESLFTYPFPSTILGNPALAFFYLISGLHALHIVGGLAAWGLTARQVWAVQPSAATARAVELCARYWHFLLLVWALMMGLFVTT